MTMDCTDDLEYAEGVIASLQAGLVVERYCRPTCQGEGEDCGDEFCGCPCHPDKQ